MNNICKNLIKIVKLEPNLINFASCAKRNQSFSYKSEISIDKLYPNSRKQIFTPPPPPQNKDSKFNGYIPIDGLDITYSRSSGPGGQNVNCLNSKVDVRFKVETANWLTEKVRTKLFQHYKTKINKDGFFVMKSDDTRSQQMNLAHALEKIRCIIRELEIENPPPSAETEEKIRRRLERASRERLMEKRNRSAVKADRQVPTLNF